MIGIAAVVLTVLCAVGLAAFYAFPPAGQHRAKRGRHRDTGQVHEGAGSDGHAEELHNLGVDPPVSLLHRENCRCLDEHVPPIGFDIDEPEWTGEHGESFITCHVGKVSGQCMCGHPDYLTCPDWLGDAEMGLNCSAGDHLCNGETFAAAPPHGPATCSCDCHAIPLSAAIKQQRATLRLAVDNSQQQRDDDPGDEMADLFDNTTGS